MPKAPEQRSATRLSRFVARAIWGVAAIPALSQMAFWSFVVRARVVLGRWPAAADPDPKDLEFFVHYWLVFWGLFGQFVAAPILLIVVVLGWYGWPRGRRRMVYAVVAYIVLLLLSAGCSHLDPWGFFRWLAD